MYEIKQQAWMDSRMYHVLLWVLLIWPTNTTSLDEADREFSREDNWLYRSARRPEVSDETCLRVHPSSRDINKRFHAILPYFDKEHSNTAFLHKFRATVHSLSECEDLLDKEAAFYAAVLTPLVFLQHYRDTWCLLERFHRALRLYQISHPTEKRTALKLLQNFKAVNQKVALDCDLIAVDGDLSALSWKLKGIPLIGFFATSYRNAKSEMVRMFIWDLPGTPNALRSLTTTLPDLVEEEVYEKGDFRFLKELVKNLG